MFIFLESGRVGITNSALVLCDTVPTNQIACPVQLFHHHSLVSTQIKKWFSPEFLLISSQYCHVMVSWTSSPSCTYLIAWSLPLAYEISLMLHNYRKVGGQLSGWYVLVYLDSLKCIFTLALGTPGSSLQNRSLRMYGNQCCRGEWFVVLQTSPAQGSR